MKHIRANFTVEDLKTANKRSKRATSTALASNILQSIGMPLCRQTLTPEDSLVDAAFASDCCDCRTAAGVASPHEKSWDGKRYGVTPEPVYVPEPRPDAEEIIASAKKNRE